MTWSYLDLADLLLIADSALHATAATFGGVEFHPDVARKSAVLSARLINDHPLPDLTIAMIEGVAAGQIDEDTLTTWITERLT